MHERLTNRQRAAAHLMSLPKDQMREILDHLSVSEQRDLNMEMATLSLTPEELTLIAGSEGSEGPHRFPELAQCHPDILAALLQRQHPQVSATVLRELPGILADQATGEFSEAYRREVTERLGRSKRPCPEVLDLLEAAIRSYLRARR